jgi:acetyl-CoA acyltransferase
MTRRKLVESLNYQGSGRPVLIDGLRTPFVKSFGVYNDADALELFSRTVDGLIRKTGIDPFELDEVIAGVVVPQTKNGNLARDAVINLGLPTHIHGYTLNRACTSGLQTITDAARSIQCGNANMVVAGGAECLSDVPIVYSKKARQFLTKLSRAKSPADKLKMLADFDVKSWLPQAPGLTEPMTGLTMGQHAEAMAQKNGVARSSQDEFAMRSHKLASAAMSSGKFEQEIFPMFPSPRFDPIKEDNLARSDTTMEALAKLKPAFDRQYGTITAGNASPMTDGAAVTLIADEARAKSLGLIPKARIVDSVFLAIDPYEQLLIGPALAIPYILKKNKLKLSDIDLIEIHEAFAAQVLSCLEAMRSNDFNQRYFGENAFGEIPLEKLNVNGGAIAIGHPFGATGGRLVTTLANELQRRQARWGLIAVCAAGAMAGAMLIENCGQ